MKSFTAIVFVMLLQLPPMSALAGEGVDTITTYKKHLLMQLTASVKPKIYRQKSPQIIPRFERPKGSVFCRMEDVVTRKSGLWLKLGVGL
jgi:hypothetical protein